MVCVTPNTPAHVAFAVMYSNKVSAVGVVAPGSEQLIANLSASDMRRLQVHHFRALALPVSEFLSQTGGVADTAVSTPGRAPGQSFMEFARAGAGVRAPIAITPATPFLRVLELLGAGSPRVHRVYITEEGRPIGVITPTDVLRFLAVRES